MSSDLPNTREDDMDPPRGSHPHPQNSTPPSTPPAPAPSPEAIAITTTWQTLMDKGRTHLARRRMELALQSFSSALLLCETHPAVLGPSQRFRVLGDLGVFIAGEVGSVLRQLGRLKEAEKRFEEQEADAKRLGGMEGARCRALGGLGVVGYQLALRAWEERKDAKEAEGLVKSAMGRLEEGGRVAREIREEEGKYWGHGPTTREREASAWEALAEGRLSLCYTLLADMDASRREAMMEKADQAARQAICYSRHLDGSVLPMSQFFYGRVLLRRGKKELALQQFNPKSDWAWNWGVTTPAMAMCKEPSEEHRGYLREIIDAGADLDILDNDGYTALDHAVFSGDAESEEIVLNGLRRHLRLSGADLAARRTEAYLRKGYREILQEKLRPILYQHAETPDCVKQLRRVYAETLAADSEKSALFDHLKYIRYADFKRFGRLPRSSDGLVRSYRLEQPGEEENELDVLIFFSYRWVNQDRTLDTPDDTDHTPDDTDHTPDDADHTQYRRMIDAAEAFLRQNPTVDAERLCIWMDFACVDQDNPGTGVSALPIIVTQCDAVISLVDETYYERAWCCVEAMMIGGLECSHSSYTVHRWYEHMSADAAAAAAATSPGSSPEQSDNQNNETGGWTLQRARGLRLNMKDKKLTYEHDRQKVMFLARQSGLLGRLRY
ncbi:hypothetical protein C8A01DRAFT_38026 [Parachaetomium inaequale]|uniref:Uncharacterized protein n=1 Tax=Parachaetomium inaequale TaxID=2588326 RepID=A0AAN6PBY0_9PEZI|nr:hypothetical protein C8A01DRAFT_38026 [Parachaetomium inaequale]